MSDSNGNGARRVVVTGMGTINPLGNDLRTAWSNCREGHSGIGPITLFDASAMPTRIAGEVRGFDAAEALGRKEARRTSRVNHLAIVAAREAVTDAGLEIGPMAEDVGVLVASGVGGLDVMERASVVLHEQGHRRVWPFTVPAMIADMPAGMVAIDLGAKGPNFCIVSACASGAHAIGEAAEIIKRGDAVAMIAGGTEAAVTPVGVASFAVMQALSERNDEPERASRPFDADRAGFVMAEGAGVLVLEDLEHARARGARVYAEVKGYGATADASHITQPCADGAGARRSMQRALQRAGARPEDVGYINAHGTGTKLNDAAETLAIRGALGEEVAHRVPISSTKSMHGHLLGAAGAVESVFTIMAMKDGYIPPTINLETPDPDCDLDYVPIEGRPATVRLALNTSYGFGGHNACLAFAAVD